MGGLWVTATEAHAESPDHIHPLEMPWGHSGIFSGYDTWDMTDTQGYHSFYGSTTIGDVDLCKTKAETACTASDSGCTWVSLKACTADQYATTTACDQSQVHTTNGKKTKFFFYDVASQQQIDNTNADTCRFQHIASLLML